MKITEMVDEIEDRLFGLRNQLDEYKPYTRYVHEISRSIEIYDAIRAALLKLRTLGKWSGEVLAMTNRWGRERSLVLLAESLRDFGEGEL